MNNRILKGAVVALAFGASASGPPAKSALPIVLTAEVPFYPASARVAGIEGTVRLQVSTDGSLASSVQVESGPIILAEAATGNVKTWRFEQHQPTTFGVVFRYRLLDALVCSLDNGVSALRLPTDVEISAGRVQTCDPSNSSGER